VSVRIYVEGGGDHNKRITDACRQAFSQFFAKVSPAQARPKVIPGGSRRATFDDFCTALKSHPSDFVVLLVDSERPVEVGDTPWSHLHKQPDGWDRPAEAQDNQAHLMVQCMEAWLLADCEETAAYFGDGFLLNSLPGQPNVEHVAKQDLLQALEHAARPTLKGQYHKTRDGFAILERIDPQKVRTASQHADRLFQILRSAPS